MDKLPVGVFTSVDAGLGVKFDVVRELGVKTIQLHAPKRESRTHEMAMNFLYKLKENDIKLTTVFLGFEGESYATIAEAAETVGLVPPKTRAARLIEAFEISDFAKLLGAASIGSHIGFVPHDRRSQEYASVVETVRSLCKYFKKKSQSLNLETGQESVESLLMFIDDVACDNLFVNFDPANLILYGIGNPLEALRKVGRRVRGVHCKDAVKTTGTPGVDWGREVPFGQGEVDAENFIKTLYQIGYQGALTIEREIPQEPERQRKEIGETVRLIEDIKTRVAKQLVT
ncbi:MAG: sugar phosphate isomerase/epimerase [Planctomycetaceae bacterium]|jgi:sugar phosphate isomerase/epimerase|nr:sugar phosphate isomerase/epimerase [Planctomycetaceae bacterium]